MTMTIDLLAQRVEILEKQMAALMADKNSDTTKSDKPSKKKTKTSKPPTSDKSDSDEQVTKPKRVSGYILFGKSIRENVKADLQAALDGDSKVKSTEVMKRIGELWKAFPDHVREDWNSKAKEMASAEA